MLLEVLPGAGGLVSQAAESPYPVGNGERKAAADVGRVGTTGQQQLADFAWLLIEIRLNESIAVNPYVDVKEVDGSCANCCSINHLIISVLLPLPDTTRGGILSPSSPNHSISLALVPVT